MNPRLATALAAFAVLGVIAGFVLHGKVLAVVAIMLAYFAVRTVIADRMRAQSERERSLSDPESPQNDTFLPPQNG